MEATGEHELVQHVARTQNLARVRELCVLGEWLAHHGLTVDEAARIQPAYQAHLEPDWRPTVAAIAGAQVGRTEDIGWETVVAAGVRAGLRRNVHGNDDRGNSQYGSWALMGEYAREAVIERGAAHRLSVVLQWEPIGNMDDAQWYLLGGPVWSLDGDDEPGSGFGAQLGVRGMLALGQRFVYAVVALLALWREHVSDAAAWVRQEHERKMLLLAEARQLSVVKLRALASLQRPPITRSVLRLLAGVMIDRVVMALLLLAAVVWLLVARWTPALGMQLAAALALIFPLGWLWRRARGAIDASDALRERAERVATLFPAAFIVMGHTHLPEVRSAAAGSTYVNLGAWAEEEMPEGAHSALPATRTHLVVVEVDGKPTASLLSWDSARGPERFVSTA